MNTIDLLSTLEIMENIKDFNVLLNCFSPVLQEPLWPSARGKAVFPLRILV